MVESAGRVSVIRMLKPWVPPSARAWLRHVESLSWLPHGRIGDFLWSLNRFVRAHHRVPAFRPRLFNDVLFHVRHAELRQPGRVRISDKETVKEYVRETVGDRYSVPTIAVLRSAGEATAYAYPDECVIKPTHMSGEVIFRRAGEAVDRERIARWFGANFYTRTREPNYATLRPKVIVEPYVFGLVYPDVAHDYKITCIDGEPRMIRIDVGRFLHHRRSYYDPAWQLQPFTALRPHYGEVPRPGNLAEMLEVAARLSNGFSFLRVDLYSDGGQILVGELTNCTGGSLSDVFIPRSGEAVASRLLWPDRWRGR